MYSPKIDERFIPAIYKLGQVMGKPMTELVNELIEKALTHEWGTALAEEEPFPTAQE